MKLIKQHSHRLKFTGDILGTSFFILLGIAFKTGIWQDIYGQIFFHSPVLSSREWVNSKTLYNASESLPNAQNPNKLIYRYTTRMQIGIGGLGGFDGATIIQETKWFSDIQDAEMIWDEREENLTYDSFMFFDFGRDHVLTNFYLVNLPPEINITSSFKCIDWDKKSRTCVYFGQYQNWFTQIWFKSSDENVLSQSQMIELIQRAVQIILESPSPEP